MMIGLLNKLTESLLGELSKQTMQHKYTQTIWRKMFQLTDERRSKDQFTFFETYFSACSLKS